MILTAISDIHKNSQIHTECLKHICIDMKFISEITKHYLADINKNMCNGFNAMNECSSTEVSE
jgi:hypothetical protein